ncbi:Na+/H+ antiporter subunit E [Marinobacter hydrocarbonoclasticus]|nr:Na+/H+ antiporter subunit E [Marinobacter nauticus]
MRPVISLALFLMLLWLSNSGHYGPLMLCLGLASTALVLWLSRRMGLLSAPLPIRFSRLPRYALWLMDQIVRANIDVVRHVWRGPGSLNPAIGRLPLPQSHELTKVVYANSITLTPGTVSLKLDGEVVEVHALNADALKALQEGEMCRRVLALEP